MDYINHPDANYPAWFRYFTIRSVLTLGPYNKEKHQFSKRSKSTTASFVDLNREALAYVYDTLNQNLEGKPIEEHADEKLASLLKSKNFGKLYAHAIEKVTPASPEQRREINGEWVKYDRIEDKEESIKRVSTLSSSLQGHGTGWCTAGESIAKTQLKGGDFYVYYSYDQYNKPTIPRVAIRMEKGQVAEVRGINEEQDLEPELIEKAEEKLADLPGGQEYQQKASDMKRLTDIENKQKAKEELTLDELRFLYEIDKEIQGFGYKKDPRIEEIQRKRDKRQDGAHVFECKPEQIAIAQKELTDETVALFGDFQASRLKVNERGEDRFPARLRFIIGVADFRESSVTDLGELERIVGNAGFKGSSVIDLGKLRSIGGNAYFSGSEITSLGKLRSIGGDAYFSNSKITDLRKLECIGGDAIIDFHTAIDNDQLAAK